MAGHTPRSMPSALDPRDPQFPQKAAALNFQVRCELAETIAATRETIAATKAMLAQADLILGKG